MDLGVKRSRLKSYLDISFKKVDIVGKNSTLYVSSNIISGVENNALKRAFRLSKMAYIEYMFYEKNKISNNDISKSVFFLLEDTFLKIFKYFEGKDDIEINEHKIIFNNKKYKVEYFENEIKNIIIENFIRPVIDGQEIFSFSYFTNLGDYKIEYNLFNGFKLRRFKMNKNILNNKYSVIKELNIQDNKISFIQLFKYKKKYIFNHFDKWYFEILNRK